MSQPRRRRRRRRQPNRDQGAVAGGAVQGQQTGSGGGQRSRRRKRGAAGSGSAAAKQISSEDLVRRAHAPRPKTLTAPPDGQKLEEIISELQSVWGVPQYPQEYRLTLKVVEERDTRASRRSSNQGGTESAPGSPAASMPPDPETVEPGPRREKAPAAPRIGGAAVEGEDAQDATPPRRKRSRRRRRGRKAS
jgi:hypothetical protein